LQLVSVPCRDKQETLKVPSGLIWGKTPWPLI